MTSVPADATTLQNPYAGPRPLSRKETLYGRDTDLDRVVQMLSVRRLMLLQAPSGAGKTSLIQAGLLERMEQYGIWALNAKQGARVIFSEEQFNQSGQFLGYNPYLLSVVASLEEGRPDGEPRVPAQLAREQLSLLSYVRERRAQIAKWKDEEDPLLLIVIDQFEEILTHQPEDIEPKKAFFAGLAEVMRENYLWVLLSMRDDFLGAMEPYLTKLPGGISDRYRLDLLNRDNAIEAIVKPAENAGVKYDAEAVKDLLVADLAEKSLYVEPVQLQVVCFNLWNKLKPAPHQVISKYDILRFADVDASLGSNYSEKLKEIENTSAAKGWSPGVSERQIRNWVKQQLIIGDSVRGQVMKGTPLTPPSVGINTLAVTALQDAHILRGETHRGLVFFELAHDRLIKPILKSNLDYYTAQADRYAGLAAAWAQAGRADEKLLLGAQLQDAEEWLPYIDTYMDVDSRELIRASQAYRERMESLLKPYLPSPSERRTNLEDLGWGVIFAADADPAIRTALMPLLRHRFQQATARNSLYYKEFSYPSLGLKTGQEAVSFGLPAGEPGMETARQFLENMGAGAGPIDPKNVPYYLLIVGGPEKIPFEFQYGLDVQYGVGRIEFDTPEQYYAYARSVVAVERGEVDLPKSMAVEAFQPGQDSTSAYLANALVSPIGASLEDDPRGALRDWQISTLRLGAGNDPGAVRGLFTGEQVPSVVFLAGPTSAKGEFTAGASGGTLLSAGDIEGEAGEIGGTLGLAAFLFGSYTAGTPTTSDYPMLAGTAVPVGGASGTGGSISRLAKAMLGAPYGGALAVFGHVERLGAYAFPQEAGADEPAIFAEVLRRLAQGYTAGAAKDALDQRYAMVLAELGEIVSYNQSIDSPGPALKFGLPMQRRSDAVLLRTIDARNYILLGDPAARLPFGKEETGSTGGTAGAKAMERERALQLPPRLVVPQGDEALVVVDEKGAGAGVLAGGSIVEISGREKTGKWARVLVAEPFGAPRAVWGRTAGMQVYDLERAPLVEVEIPEEAGIAKGVESYATNQVGAAGTASKSAGQSLSSAAVELELHLSAGKGEDLYMLEMAYTTPGSAIAASLPGSMISLRPVAILQTQEPGGELTRQLLSGEVGDFFRRALVNAQSRALPLRIRVRIDDTAAELHRLPWEDLRDTTTQRPMLENHAIWLSRYVWSPSWQPVEAQPKRAMRVLLVTGPGRKQRNAARWREALAPLLDGNQAQELKIGTLEELQAALKAEPIDLLYLGAGMDQASLSSLAGLFAALPRANCPRLVIFVPTILGVANLSPVDLAAALLGGGVLAVLALDGTAVTIGVKKALEKFATELRRDGRLDRAASAAISPLYPWALMLFTRQRDGMLWSSGPVDVTSAVYQAAALPTEHVYRRGLSGEVTRRLRDEKSRADVALLGMPGCGRGRVAEEACAALKNDFKDGILWATLENRLDPANLRLVGIIQGWLAALVGQSPEFSNAERASAALGEALTRRRVLLVIEEPNEARALDLLAGGPDCRRLIVTQNPVLLGEKTEIVSVGRMRRGEAIDALGKGISGCPAALLDRLAERLGDWPLALGLANRQMRDAAGRGDAPEKTVDYLLKQLDARGPLALDLPYAGGEKSATLNAVYSSAFASLSTGERARLFELGIFAPGRTMHRSAVERLWNATGGLDTSGADGLLGAIDNLRLLEAYDRKSGTLQLHPLFAEFLAKSLGEQAAGLHNRLLDSYTVERWTQWGASEPYIWENAAYHLVAGGRRDFLTGLLLNPGWLQARLRAPDGLGGLLADFELISPDSTLDRVAAALRLSAAALRRKPADLTAQLLGRLLVGAEGDSRLLALLNQTRSEAKSALVPLNGGLTAPGGPLVAALPGHGEAAVRQVFFTPDGRRALSIAANGEMILWDLGRLQPISVKGAAPLRAAGSSPIVSAAVSPLAEVALAVTVDRHGQLEAWDLRAGASLGEMAYPQGHKGEGGMALAITPDGKTLLGAPGRGWLFGWNIPSLEAAFAHAVTLRDGITAIAAMEGSRVVLGTEKGRLYLVQMADGKPGDAANTERGSVLSLTLNGQDGNTLFCAGANGAVSIWTVRENKIYQTALKDLGTAKFAVGASLLAAGHSDGTVQTIDSLRMTDLTRLAGHCAPVTAMTLHPGGSHALSAGADGSILYWDLSRVSPANDVRYTTRDYAFGVTTDGSYAVGIQSDGMRLINLKKFTFGQANIEQSPVKFGASMVTETPVVALAALDRRHVGLITQTSVSVLDFEGEALVPASLVVNDILIDVFSDPKRGTLTTWTQPSGDTPTTDRLRSYTFRGAERGAAQVRRVEEKLIERHLLLAGRGGLLERHANERVKALECLQGGNIEATAWSDGKVRVWQRGMAQELELEGHKGSANGLAAIGGAKERALLASVGADGCLVVWDASGGQALARYQGDLPLTACAWAPGSPQAILASDSAGRLHLLEFRTQFAATQEAVQRAQPALFQPKAKFLWQNVSLRPMLFPWREEKLRDFLLWSYEAERVFYYADRPKARQLNGEIAQYGSEIARLSHDELVERVLDFFEHKMDGSPVWLAYMVIHFSGMRGGAARATWADPAALVARLEGLASRQISDGAWRTKMAEINASELSARGILLEEGTGEKANKGREITTRASAEQRLLEFLTAKDVIQKERTEREQALDRLAAMRQRMAFPGWFWRQMVALTDLRLAISGGDWLTDWEGLPPAELAERAKGESGPWLDTLIGWVEQASDWREAHIETLQPLVTRVLSNEISDMIFHLRGIRPIYGIARRAGRIGRYEGEINRSFGARPTLSDFKPGTLLMRFEWIDTYPYPWEAVEDRTGLMSSLQAENPGWLVSTGMYRREDGTPLMQAIYREKRALTKRAEGSGAVRQWLAWREEAVVVSVNEMQDGTTLLYFSALPRTGIQRVTLKEFVEAKNWLVGEDPEMMVYQAPDLSGLLRREALLPGARQGPFSEFTPPATYEPYSRQVGKMVDELEASERQVVAMSAAGASIEEIGLMMEASNDLVRKLLVSAEQKLGVGSLSELRLFVANVHFGALQAATSRRPEVEGGSKSAA